MSIRKAIPFLIIFLAGAFFGKPLALGGVGLLAKAYLFFDSRMQFSYGSIDWQDGKIVLSEVDLNQKRAFKSHAKRVKVSLSSKHLEVDQPRIVLLGKPRFKKSSDWLFAVKEGTIAKGDLGEIRFSCERNWPNQMGRFSFEKEGSKCDLEALREGGEIWIYASLHRFETKLLQGWIDLPFACSGRVDGQAHLVFEGRQCKRGSAHLDIREGVYGEAISKVAGSVDWEGNVGPSCLSEGRLRVSLAQGSIKGREGGIEEMDGEFSYASGLGAKWEFEGKGSARGEQFPLSCKGRAFLQDSRPHWVESNALLGEARFSLNAKEEEAGYCWEGDFQRIGPAEGTLIQSLLALSEESYSGVDFQKGSVNIQAKARVSSEGIKEWDFAGTAENVVCMQNQVEVKCRGAAGGYSSQNAGAFSFDGASFVLPLAKEKKLTGNDWAGEGRIENGAFAATRLEGILENHKAAFALSGTPEAFEMEISGQEGRISLAGQWKEEQLDWKIKEGMFEGLSFQGGGWIGEGGTFALHLDQFEGNLTPLYQTLGGKGTLDGRIRAAGEGFSAEGTFDSCDWSLQAKGETGSGIGFYCPILEKKGEQFSFDIRIENPSWDWVRLYGVWDGLECRFDPERTHFLGKPLQIDSCIWDGGGLSKLQLHALIPLQSFLAAVPFWFPETKGWSAAPIAGVASVDLSFFRDGGSSFSIDGPNLSWMGAPMSVHLAACEENGAWRLSTCQIDQFLISGTIQNVERALHFSTGALSCDGIAADFHGVIDASLQCEFQFPFLRLDLGKVHSMASSVGVPLAGLDGVLEGKGCLSWKGKLEADFDFAASGLRAASMSWENDGPIHLCYSSERGVLCSGLDLQVPDRDLHLKIDLLQYDAPRTLWILSHSRIYLSPDFLHHFPNLPAILKGFDPGAGIDLSADLECPSDFSYLSCYVKEGLIPFAGAVRSIRDLSFYFDENDAKLSLQYVHQGHAVRIGANVSLGHDLSGRLNLEEIERPLQEGERPLSIDWTYCDGTGFSIREIEGRFGGIEASFHALDSASSLIGSARVHFGALSELVPARIAQLFRDLKMGKGYELKGRLCLDKGQLSFKGLFSGKQIDLFGYELRTLLGQIDLAADHVRIYDLKISDSAGIMKIDSIEAKGIGEAPWTVSMPRLTLLELRPSLLQKEGVETEPGPAGPLVVREFKIDDFKGLLDDSKTYTAKGELTFINSYRREHTVFDIPSDLLGRIVGLDLELLIPVCGVLRYDLKDGFFRLKELQEAYSEAKRSEFFLVTEPAPTMDLDGNLHILVNMKQFVLFKFTESFLISIDGKLNDPQYHLQKKSRFLGL